MFDVPALAILIPALPLAATLATAALGRHVLRQRSHVPVITALGLAFLASTALLVQVYREAGPGQDPGKSTRQEIPYERIVTLWTWASVPGAYESAPKDRFKTSEVPETSEVLGPAGSSADYEGRDLRVAVTLRADPLSAVMLVTVTLVSLVVAIYSVGYMHGDPGYWRFFTYIGLFVFSMTMLVSVSNFALLYVFWEGVGLCSYLLIGFWFQKPEAAAAGKKAFLVNRVGDFGFALAVFLIWIAYGTLDFHDTMTGSVVTSRGVLGQAAASDAARVAGGAVGTAICLLLLLGACGKSAQLPLHVWLPDAMEGPTPVSALIHAATMVTAGVYLVARCAPLFAASPDALHAVAAVGGLTALVAAVIAITQNDLKRILAYSTISQLGYMFLALGTGTALGVVAAMFHLVTHAFFKGLLFLGAGSVMHAMGGVVDIRRLGGLRRRLPVTCWTYLLGSLALAGVIPMAGFWSKDAILAAVNAPSPSAAASAFYHCLFWVAMATAGLTAFYTFRAFFLVFTGPERIPPEAGGHARESSLWMTLPLVFLALASIDVGMHLQWTGSLREFLARAPSIVSLGGIPHAAEAEGDWTLAGVSTAVVLLGIALAWLVYRGAPASQRWLVPLMEATGLYRLSSNKFYFDQAYRGLVVRPLERLARTAASFDHWLIDGLVDLIGTAPRGMGALLRPLQGGLVQFYAVAMVVGLVVLLGALLIF